MDVPPAEEAEKNDLTFGKQVNLRKWLTNITSKSHKIPGDFSESFHQELSSLSKYLYKYSGSKNSTHPC